MQPSKRSSWVQASTFHRLNILFTGKKTTFTKLQNSFGRTQSFKLLQKVKLLLHIYQYYQRSYSIIYYLSGKKQLIVLMARKFDQRGFLFYCFAGTECGIEAV